MPKARSISRVIAVAATCFLVASACSAKGSEGAEGESGVETSQTGSSEESSDAEFGDMGAPCGEGDLKVDPEEGNVSNKLTIGVANDRTSDIRPGLNVEMWDASNAFANWCNEQGGIGGLPIEIIDLDAALFEVESAMTRACQDAFMMVGGGWVQDNLAFSGKPESDFHECGMVDIPGIAVSPQKGNSNGQVQPLPHSSDSISTNWAKVMLELDPEGFSTGVEVWGDLPAMETIRNEEVAVLEAVGVDVKGVISYPVTGMTDWTPLAQQIIDTGAETLHFIGEPTNLGALLLSLRTQGWKGTAALPTNMYDQTVIDNAGPDGAEGMLVRTSFHPFEEADQWPAIEQFSEILTKYQPNAKQALLGLNSFSAWLLFATAANNCAESNDGVLTRACVLTAAADVDDWTAGGLHAPTDPGSEGGTPSNCGMVLTVNDSGEFVRHHPEIGSDDDHEDGFDCSGEIIEVEENKGLGILGPNQPA